MQKFISIAFALLLMMYFSNIIAQKNNSTRIIVTSDGEIDDMNSFMRLLLYSNELNLTGLVYSSSEFHYKGDGKGTKFTSQMSFAKQYGARTNLRWLGTEWMKDYIDKYATVYTNLLKHDKNYPSPQYLKSIVKVGNIDFESEMDHNTEGSDYIKNILLDDKSTPVYLLMWGGTNTVARALKSIEDEYKNTVQWKAVYKKVSDKTILYIILDQDETYKKYVSVNWPDVRVIYNSTQFWCLAYPWKRFIPAAYQPYFSGDWFKQHIISNHGALVDGYFLWGDGQKLVSDSEHTQGSMAEATKNNMAQYDFISEGDSPSYFFLINTGLRNQEDASYGGWGGRFAASATNPRIWKDGNDVTDYNDYDKKQDFEYPQTRWAEALQNDFAARADWCVKPYNEANHPPVVALNTAKDIIAKPNTVVHLSGSAKDPDKDNLSHTWWQYKEAGSYNGDIKITDADKATASFTVPADAKNGQTIHIVFEVKDNGTPPLTRYQRVIVTVK